MEYKDIVFTKEIVELMKSVCNRRSFGIICNGNCSVKKHIKELGKKIISLGIENKSLASKAKFYESEANAWKYEEYA